MCGHRKALRSLHIPWLQGPWLPRAASDLAQLTDLCIDIQATNVLMAFADYLSDSTRSNTSVLLIGVGQPLFLSPLCPPAASAIDGTMNLLHRQGTSHCAWRCCGAPKGRSRPARLRTVRSLLRAAPESGVDALGEAAMLCAMTQDNAVHINSRESAAACDSELVSASDCTLWQWRQRCSALMLRACRAGSHTLQTPGHASQESSLRWC